MAETNVTPSGAEQINPRAAEKQAQKTTDKLVEGERRSFEAADAGGVRLRASSNTRAKS